MSPVLVTRCSSNSLVASPRTPPATRSGCCVITRCSKFPMTSPWVRPGGATYVWSGDVASCTSPSGPSRIASARGGHTARS